MHEWDSPAASTVDHAAYWFFEWASGLSAESKKNYQFLSRLIEDWMCSEGQEGGLRACGRNFECFQAAVITIIHVWTMRKLGLDENIAPEAADNPAVPEQVVLVFDPSEAHHAILDRYWFDYINCNEVV